MAKSKNKKKGDLVKEVAHLEQDDEQTDEYLSKNLDENNVIWFHNILKTQIKKHMKEIMPEINQQLIEEVEKMRLELETKYNTEINKLLEKNLDCIKELEQNRKQLSRMEYEICQKDKKINELFMKIDETEQKMYRNDVEIVGVEESQNHEEDVKKIVKIAKEKIGVKIKKSDIEELYRRGKRVNSKKRHIVVKFKEQKIKEEFYERRK